MARSKDLLEIMKTKFNLKELGFLFSQPRTGKEGKFDRSKFTLYLEFDRNDLPKRAAMEQYFNHYPRSLNNTIFGTPMILTKVYDYFAEDNIKESLDNHARKQTSLGKSMRSTIISGVQLINWANSK